MITTNLITKGKVMEYEIQTHYLFTVEKAKQLLKSNYAHNRKLEARQVAFLARQMERGDFLPNENIQIAVLDEEEILVDGQHRLSAIVESEMSVTMPLQTFQCTSMQEVNTLYANCDVGKPRSFMVQMRGNEGERKMGIKLSDIGRIKAAVSFMHSSSLDSGNIRIKYSSGEWMEICSPWVEEYIIYKSIVSNGVVGIKMLSAPIAAAALLTIKYEKEKAVDFWSDVSNDDMLPQSAPAKTLNKFILTHSLSARGSAKQKSVGRSVMFSACAKAWNKHLSGDKVKLVSSLGKGKLSLPNKTPYDGTYQSVS